eukprot:433550-Prymnesium_polylepis.1
MVACWTCAKRHARCDSASLGRLTQGAGADKRVIQPSQDCPQSSRTLPPQLSHPIGQGPRAQCGRASATKAARERT